MSDARKLLNFLGVLCVDVLGCICIKNVLRIGWSDANAEYSSRVGYPKLLLSVSLNQPILRVLGGIRFVTESRRPIGTFEDSMLLQQKWQYLREFDVMILISQLCSDLHSNLRFLNSYLTGITQNVYPFPSLICICSAHRSHPYSVLLVTCISLSQPDGLWYFLIS